MMRQPKRRYRLIVENGKGKVVPYVPGDDDEQRDSTTIDRPGVEKPIQRPWVAVPKRD
jgi:hypothetical protein